VVAAPANDAQMRNGASTPGSLVALEVTGLSGWAATITSGVFTANIYFEGSLDSTTGTDGNWISLFGRIIGNSGNENVSFTNTNNQFIEGACGALKFVRLRAVGGAITSPLALILQAGNVNSVSVLTPLPTGTNVIGHVIVDSGPASSVVTQPSGANLHVDVDNFPATQPVSAVTLPLPTGAATAAKQPALGVAGTPSTDVLSVQGTAGMTAVKTDGSGVTQPVSGTVTSNVGTTGGLALDATLTGGTQKTKIVDAGGTNVATVDATGDVQVDVNNFPATQAVTAAALPLPANAAQETGGNLATLAGAVTAAVVQENVKQVGGTAVVTAAAGVQLVGIEGRAGTSLETTAGVLDENLKNVGNAAVVTAAAGVQKVGIVGNAGTAVDSTAAAGAAPNNAVLTSGVFNTNPPAPTTGQAMAIQFDSTGSQFSSVEGRKASYLAAYRLADATAGQLGLTFTFVVNTNKQLATIYHAAGATKLVKIHFISITPSLAAAASVFDFEVRALNATTPPATGNPAIIPGKFAQADAAAEAACLALPTTAGSLVAADSPVSGAFEWNAGIGAATTNPGGLAGQEIVLFNDMLPGVKPLTMRPATAEGYAINGRSTVATSLRFTMRIIFTEE
jgi:hypothetical protein